MTARGGETSVRLVKVALIRETGVPVGQPARMFLNCPCGARPEQRTDCAHPVLQVNDEGVCCDCGHSTVTVCSCGRAYNQSGYLTGGAA